MKMPFPLQHIPMMAGVNEGVKRIAKPVAVRACEKL